MVVVIDPPLKAKNGHTLRVLFVVRVSNPGPGKQDIRSNDDQQAKNLEWLRARTNLPFELNVIAGSGSGEHLDRDEYLQLIDLVETGLWDLVICEDLGRIVRRIQAHLFAKLCVDYNTRLVSINDFVDTAVDGWQDRSIFSAWHHERSNRDTSERIKRTHSSRFMHGGDLRRLIPGYIKPPGAKTDEELYKDPYWEAIYDEWFTRLENGESFSQIADWLNAIGAPTGCKPTKKKAAKGKYDCQLVGQRTRNVNLKGVRERNNRVSQRVNSSGRRRSVKAPPEMRLTRFCPNMVFIEPERYDRVLSIVEPNNSKYRVKGEDGRKNRPKKRTRAMGQHSYCAICGRLFVFGGHGQRTHLMCDGARKHKCWNGAAIDGPLAALKILIAVMHEIEQLEDFDAALLSVLNEEARRFNESRDRVSAELNRDHRQIQAEVDNVLTAVRRGTSSQLLDAELQRLETKMSQLKSAVLENQRNRIEEVKLPSAAAIKLRFQKTLGELPIDELEFAHHLRNLIPRIVVRPVMLCDGGKVELRATFRLQLSALVEDAASRRALKGILDRVLTVDLFEPPFRTRARVPSRRAQESGQRRAHSS